FEADGVPPEVRLVPLDPWRVAKIWRSFRASEQVALRSVRSAHTRGHPAYGGAVCQLVGPDAKAAPPLEAGELAPRILRTPPTYRAPIATTCRAFQRAPDRTTQVHE